MTDSSFTYRSWPEPGADALRPHPQRTLKPLPEVAAGRYRIERLLGVGGMAAVYEVRDLFCEQFDHSCPRLAIKTLNDECSEHPDAELLLYTEYRLLRQVRHPHIVQANALERDEHSGRAFLVLELVRGPCLEQWIAENPTRDGSAEAREIALQLVEAVEHCHRQSVIHGDLKPSNVLLSNEGIRLLDFGLGRSPSKSLPCVSRERFAAWTPRYVAPEVQSGSQVSVASDIYALACVLAELAGGVLHQSTAGTKPPAAPWLKAPRLSERGQIVLLKALAQDPTERNVGISELREVFRQGKRSRWWPR